MPLKIFISSVSGEFDAERMALESAIQRLGELYVGMEYFGSDPRCAFAFDDASVKDSDLYVGLFGDRFGSVERSSGKSFTELEYDAARGKGVPALAYFKRAFLTGAEEPRQATLKQRVQQDQLGAVFQDAHELELQFLIDLFKQIRGPLFAKLSPQLGLIPFDALHAVTKGLLPEQIRAVGQDKYIPEIYVPRPAEDLVREFVDFEEIFAARSQQILDAVESMAGRYGFENSAKAALEDARAAVIHSHDPQRLVHAATALKRVCFFDSVEADFARLELIYRQSDSASAAHESKEFAVSMYGRPYVDRSKLTELPETIFEIARMRRAGKQPGVFKDGEVRSLFPSILVGDNVVLANDVLKEFDRLAERASKRCIALVDKAGRGKTNVICRIAERTLEKHAVILLSGQMEISSEYHIEWHVQHRLEEVFGAAFTDWMSRSAAALEQARRWLFVVVDGINESANSRLFVRLLQSLLPKLAGKRIKLILSCRDIYWDLFLPSMRPYLFGDGIPLNEFSEDEWQRALRLYFDRFQIFAEVDDQAARSLRNPLLLRFFCEAYQRKSLGRVSDIHLLSIFRLYIERVGSTIAERLGLLTPDPVLALLLNVVICMWQDRVPAIEQSRLGLTPEETASSVSIYNLVRSENVILDESRHRQSALKVVRFVYDEFMEYMLARSWVEEIVASPEEESAADAILQQAVDAVIAFPAAMGAILFLDQMLERNGRLVNRALALSGPVSEILLHARQATLLYALENIDAGSVDDGLLDMVDRFETVAVPELRPRLARVILHLFEKNRDRSALRPVVGRILEVCPGPRGKVPRVPSAKGTRLATKFRRKSTTPKGDASSVPPAEAEADIPLLPPARYHYSDETKLNAIGLIIGSRNPRDYELVEQGIRKLGRMDLHSALQALASVDLADDDFVYRTIAGHMSAKLPEYRIYCAWLLRDRYGPKPAELFLQLLSAEETRVHTYAFGLFETRQIERELVEGILREMGAFERTKSWHLVYQIKLLSMRGSFIRPDFAQTLGQAILHALKAVSKHRLPHIRLAAYRSLAAYPELVDRSATAAWMRADAEPHIRALADQTAG